ncbi:unnamed protein product [Didymodactylos carnosus]|uniref:Uncharacterized protein n=1 Tax=Didymodactylos carnosus TaxID=1234261 RepID=A0A815UKE4_9BILA|nr:unnamed protein product [Didymodactylos carnosus]CAF1521074.1 unnamed protein product [Didymodactylos carnosus]CAF3761161.1 unnamed protein product [Didymodactylos carnosus]CAF4380479.1 unnamed protein product [Didymodactylos carnosus]
MGNVIGNIMDMIMDKIMGNIDSEQKSDNKMLKRPVSVYTSDFYMACRNGDAELLRQMLSLRTFRELNQLEPNGNTSLHAAAFYGHCDIVKMLLEGGCMRSKVNLHGLTAWEEAATDEIRQLFERPQEGRNRFCGDASSQSFEITAPPAASEIGTDEKEEFDRDKWLEGYKSLDETVGDQCAMRLCKNRVIRFGLSKSGDDLKFLDIDWCYKDLRRKVNENVPESHPERAKADHLLDKLQKTRRVIHLIHLFTLETPFYRALHHDNDAFSATVLVSLSQLRNRVFQGRSYRGMSATVDNLRAYRWAHENKGSLLRTQTIMSTSLERSKAEQFAETNDPSNISVLFILDFPEPCPFAINLCKISNEFPCISEFQDEQEILLLVNCLFEVTDSEGSMRKCQRKFLLRVDGGRGGDEAESLRGDPREVHLSKLGEVRGDEEAESL